MGRSFAAQLRDAENEQAARDADPWRIRLERLRGKVGHDGIERVPTQAIYDILGIPQRHRASGTSRRLASLMTELGWRAVRYRELTRQGFKDKVRGYARLYGP
jgi:hypothetical protein